MTIAENVRDGLIILLRYEPNAEIWSGFGYISLGGMPPDQTSPEDVVALEKMHWRWHCTMWRWIIPTTAIT